MDSLTSKGRGLLVDCAAVAVISRSGERFDSALFDSYKIAPEGL